MLVFIDNILIYSSTIEKHEKNLRIALQTLRDHQLYTKFCKCEFYETQVQYLEHVIFEEGIVVYLKNVKPIMDWLVLKDVQNIRSFMGITGYYQRFIGWFSKLSYPFFSLQKKGMRFNWIKNDKKALSN